MPLYYNPDDGSFWRHDPPPQCVEVPFADNAVIEEALAEGGNARPKKGGGWKIYRGIDQPPPDVLVRSMRNTRNALLAETDKWMVEDADITPAKKQEWKAYRKALRDITQTYPDGQGIIWPVPPQ